MALKRDLRSAKAELAELKKQPQQDLPKPEIVAMERAIRQMERNCEKFGEAIDKLAKQPQAAPSSTNVSVDTTPIGLELSRLSELIGAMNAPKPDKSFRLIHKRNDFGAIVETIIEPLDESDDGA